MLTKFILKTLFHKAITSHIEASFLDLNLLISNGIITSKFYDKQDYFNFDSLIFLPLDSDIPNTTSYEVYLSQPIRFARTSGSVSDFNYCSKLLTAKLLKQGYRLHKLRKQSLNFTVNILNEFLNKMMA